MNSNANYIIPIRMRHDIPKKQPQDLIGLILFHELDWLGRMRCSTGKLCRRNFLPYTDKVTINQSVGKILVLDLPESYCVFWGGGGGEGGATKC